jgi:AraC-like DNA-binding protein
MTLHLKTPAEACSPDRHGRLGQDACRIDLRRCAPARRMAVWRAAVGDHYDVVTEGDAATALEIDLEAYRLDRMVVSRLSASARAARRRAPRAGGGNMLKFRVNEIGTCRLSTDGEEVALGPGAVHVVDHARDRMERYERHRTLSVWAPHAALGWRTGERPPVLSFGFGTASGLMLRDAIESTLAAARIATRRETAALAGGFAALAGAILDGAALSETVPAARAARTRAMRRFLDARLRDPELGVDALLDAFGASRATVFRDFADVGGVARYIRGRRLDRAFDDLATAEPSRGVVARVAEKWRFSSTAHFSEAFRDAFGCTPGSALGIRAAAAPDRPDPEALSWIGDPELERDVARLRALLRMMREC